MTRAEQCPAKSVTFTPSQLTATTRPALPHPAAPQQFVKLFNTEPLRSALLPCPRWHKQIGPLINLLVNDSVKTEACLRYRGRQLVVGVTWLALKLLKEDTKIYTGGWAGGWGLGWAGRSPLAGHA